MRQVSVEYFLRKPDWLSNKMRFLMMDRKQDSGTVKKTERSQPLSALPRLEGSDCIPPPTRETYFLFRFSTVYLLRCMQLWYVLLLSASSLEKPFQSPFMYRQWRQYLSAPRKCSYLLSSWPRKRFCLSRNVKKEKSCDIPFGTAH